MFFFIARTTRNYVYLYMLYMYCTNSNTVVLFFIMGTDRSKCPYLRGVFIWEVLLCTQKLLLRLQKWPACRCVLEEFSQFYGFTFAPTIWHSDCSVGHMERHIERVWSIYSWYRKGIIINHPCNYVLYR